MKIANGVDRENGIMNDKQSARYLVQEDLTGAIARILADLQVVDLTVSDPPIEEVIGRVFQAGAVV